MTGYEFDVFVSYSRRGNVAEWVHRHFEPVLRRCLIDELGPDSEVFLDTGIEVGARWPEKLRDGLARSRMMVAIWSAAYFHSPWCMAEWETFHERGQLEGVQCLVYPIVFADGENFPARFRGIQHVDVKRWNFPYPAFAESLAFLDFHTFVRETAEELGQRRKSVPEWRPGWPVVTPQDLPSRPQASLPRL